MKDYYQILGLPRDAAPADISAKLRERKRLWVQRQNAPRPEQRQEAEQNLRLVPEMESTLLDVTKRKTYDERLRSTPPEIPQSSGSHELDQIQDIVAKGWALVGEGSIPDALYAAVLACERNPGDSAAWALRGHCQNAWGDRDDAIASYRKAISLKPNNADLYFELASIYEDAERWDEAEKEYRRASQIDRGNTLYDACIGQIQFKRGNLAEGVRILEECIAKEPNNRMYRGLLALAYVDQGIEGWTYIDGTGYITTKVEDLTTAEAYLAKAEQLAGDEPDVQSSIKEQRECIEAARKRRFHGNPVAPAVWGLMGFMMFVSGGGGVDAAVGGMFVIGLSVLYVLSCMTPQYRLNQRVLDGKTETSTTAMFDGSDGGCAGMIFMFVIVLALMPFMMVINFIKNYVIK